MSYVASTYRHVRTMPITAEGLGTIVESAPSRLEIDTELVVDRLLRECFTKNRRTAWAELTSPDSLLYRAQTTTLRPRAIASAESLPADAASSGARPALAPGARVVTPSEIGPTPIGCGRLHGSPTEEWSTYSFGENPIECNLR
jgi:hypothetical protein